MKIHILYNVYYRSFDINLYSSQKKQKKNLNIIFVKCHYGALELSSISLKCYKNTF